MNKNQKPVNFLDPEFQRKFTADSVIDFKKVEEDRKRFERMKGMNYSQILNNCKVKTNPKLSIDDDLLAPRRTSKIIGLNSMEDKLCPIATYNGMAMERPVSCEQLGLSSFKSKDITEEFSDNEDLGIELLSEYNFNDLKSKQQINQVNQEINSRLKELSRQKNEKRNRKYIEGFEYIYNPQTISQQEASQNSTSQQHKITTPKQKSKKKTSSQ